MKLIKKMTAAMCALFIATSAFAALTVSAANSPSQPLDIYLQEASHTAKGIYTINVNYKDYVENTGVAALSLLFELSDSSVVEKMGSCSVVDIMDGATTNYYTENGKGYLRISQDNTNGDVFKDVTKTSGTIATAKFKMATDAIASDGSLNKALTMKLVESKLSAGDKEYDEDFDEWSFDSTKAIEYKTEDGAVVSSAGLEWKSATPDPTPTTPDYVYNGKDTKWGAATFVGDYSTADDKAIAVKAEVKPGQKVVDGALVDNTYTGLVWKAVKADGTAVGYEQSGLSITGNGTYVFGLAIDGVSQTEVQTNGFGIAVK